MTATTKTRPVGVQARLPDPGPEDPTIGRTWSRPVRHPRSSRTARRGPPTARVPNSTRCDAPGRRSGPARADRGVTGCFRGYLLSVDDHGCDCCDDDQDMRSGHVKVSLLVSSQGCLPRPRGVGAVEGVGVGSGDGAGVCVAAPGGAGLRLTRRMPQTIHHVTSARMTRVLVMAPMA